MALFAIFFLAQVKGGREEIHLFPASFSQLQRKKKKKGKRKRDVLIIFKQLLAGRRDLPVIRRYVSVSYNEGGLVTPLINILFQGNSNETIHHHSEWEELAGPSVNNQQGMEAPWLWGWGGGKIQESLQAGTLRLKSPSHPPPPILQKLERHPLQQISRSIRWELEGVGTQ